MSGTDLGSEKKAVVEKQKTKIRQRFLPSCSLHSSEGEKIKTPSTHTHTHIKNFLTNKLFRIGLL